MISRDALAQIQARTPRPLTGWPRLKAAWRSLIEAIRWVRAERKRQRDLKKVFEKWGKKP